MVPEGHTHADDLAWESWARSVALHHEWALAEMARQRRSGLRGRMDRVLDHWVEKEFEASARMEQEIPCPRHGPLN